MKRPDLNHCLIRASESGNIGARSRCFPHRNRANEIHTMNMNNATLEIQQSEKEHKPERWLPVVGYEGLYEVSDMGNVRSLERRVRHMRGGTQILRARILRPGKSKRGYPNVGLCKDGVVTRKKVHAIEAVAFFGAQANKLCVNHKDGDKNNNCLENLEYLTHAENMAHAARTGLIRKGPR